MKPWAVVFTRGVGPARVGELLANGGRVLGVTALGKDVAEAQAKAYKMLVL